MKDLKKGKIPKFPEHWPGCLAEAASLSTGLNPVSLRVSSASLPL
jgi:hypothetical protein